MGWDAFSSIKTYWGYTEKGAQCICIFPDKKQRDAFRRAARRVKKLAGKMDGYLGAGALDCSASARMLQRATGEDCLKGNNIVWSKRKVRSLAKRANWGFKCTAKDKAAYWSARVFLETCSELGLSISMGH